MHLGSDSDERESLVARWAEAGRNYRRICCPTFDVHAQGLGMRAGWADCWFQYVQLRQRRILGRCGIARLRGPRDWNSPGPAGPAMVARARVAGDMAMDLARQNDPCLQLVSVAWMARLRYPKW